MADKQRIRITSDGTSGGTTVTDVDTGVELKGITSLSWSCDAEHQVARATVEFHLVDVVVVGEVEQAEPEQGWHMVCGSGHRWLCSRCHP